MSGMRSAEYLAGLVRELCKLPKETEWLEFKVDNTDPREMGEQLSALANSAALAGKAQAYFVWGVDDASHDIVGTQFSPALVKVGNEELESWLLHLLSPKIEFRFFEVEIGDKRVVLLEIEGARGQPVQFHGHEYVRVGTYKKKLKDFPEKERALWRIFDRVPFEGGIAAEHIADEDAFRLLDFSSYFSLIGRPIPETKQGVLAALAEEALICACDAGGWNITNLGAVLFATRLDQFSGLSRKAIRVIVYKGNSRIETSREQLGTKGYASGFEGLIAFINGLVPSNEVIQQALRKTVPMYPELAVRELVVNVLIHQDFFMTGTGPMVEIFSDRMEVTNPGKPLVAADRFLDTPPKSRNEVLASLMRRMGICEERGSGIDKVVFQTELFQLPAPLFEVTGESTRAVLFAHRSLTKMDKEDRVRACYLHACLKYVNREHLTNTTVRGRFGIEQQNIATASRLIKEAVDAGAIAPVDPDSAKSHRRYVPWWAAPSGTDDKGEK
jgi:ATP-dependent DNA helicase RecG